MKKIIIVFMWIVTILVSCKKETGNNEEFVKPEARKIPTCGMEEAMASLSPEMREAMLKSVIRTEVQANELLLFLDFDGAVIRKGNANAMGIMSPIIRFSTANCPPPALTEQQKHDIVKLVKDDYSPFNIMVTTDQAIFDTYAPASYKQICIITTNPFVAGFPSNVGGVAPFAGLGTRLPFNPCFVFANGYGGDVSAVAAVISHEVAHTMGLGHQHRFNEECGYIAEYHPGFGTGAVSFVPIMGLSDLRRITNWWAQSCYSPVFGQVQHDFALLNSQVVVREDDFPNSPSANSTHSSGEINGILEQAGDADFILINFRNPGPVTITSENIDLKVSVYNLGGHLLSEHNDPNDTHVTIPSTNGKRYLKIEAVSNANVSSQFLTGQYKVTF